MLSSQRPKPFALIILDGWGHCETKQHNPIQNVATPTFDFLFSHYPHCLLHASGIEVGLPPDQMGNSEVGHLHIGAGRKVPQDLTRIDLAIQNGSFFQNPTLCHALEHAKANQTTVHILVLLSPGGVHSRDDHLLALIQLAHQHEIQRCYLHAILDGRDTPPQSAEPSLEKAQALFAKTGHGRIASVVGRYTAMDRDKRWERTREAYEMLTAGHTPYHAHTAVEALKMAYARGETDEFIKPTIVCPPEQDLARIQDGDIVIFMNFRADRARQLSYALTDPQFSGFERSRFPKLAHFVTLTEYDKNLQADVAYPPIDMHNTMGEFLAQKGLHQLRLAETEKYAHVTYFLNGGVEQPFPGEDRKLIPSPKVATYDLQPEMSAYEVTDTLVQAITSQRYDVIVCNYANPDMVGHTGIESAAETAISVMDQCIKRVIDALQSVGGEALITADHGNIECMYDESTQQPHTAHTQNLVPLIYVGKQGTFKKEVGALDDIAPTLLNLLGLQPPPEMTGHNLLS